MSPPAARRGRSTLSQSIEELQPSGATSPRAIAAGLNEGGIETARGGTWSPTQVARVLDRLTT
ncbi:MAG: recombinase family protein [Bradyrhizobium sp.]